MLLFAAPKKKKTGGAGDPESESRLCSPNPSNTLTVLLIFSEEEAINKTFSTFKLEYKRQCEALGVPPVEPIERVPFIERVKRVHDARPFGSFSQCFVLQLAIYGQPIGPVGSSALVAAVSGMDPALLKVLLLTGKFFANPGNHRRWTV